ncbi:uncharacterized protein LOC133205021 [Saccostrea echinata]|uniref:uncharacterized protein LOC133205021 n=1 Tax=Saccostrea echinata TaxID=191078 RepID=UPI002A8161F9|nr:uncharacterized protein LOC133205021 [Saccostrea echinata]
MTDPGNITSNTPEPEPEIYSTSAEPEVYYNSTTAHPEPEPEGSGSGWPEPEPEWSSAIDEWGPAWPFHTYFFGCSFLIADILAICFLFRAIKGYNRHYKSSLSGSLLAMLIMFCSLRFICLIVDPYHTEKVFTRLAARLLWSLGSPFLLSSFSLVLLALIDTTKMSVGPPKFQKLPAILGFTASHVILVISTDLSVLFFPETDPLLVVCQGLFIVFGFLMCVGYLYVAVKIRSNLSASFSQLQKGCSGISRLIFTCYVSSVIGFMIIATHIYAASGVFGVFSDVKFVDSWSWWALQTLMRSEELAEVIVVLCVAKRSLLPKQALKRLVSCLKCCNRDSVKKIQIFPLDDTFEQTHDINTDNLRTNNGVKSTTLH